MIKTINKLWKCLYDAGYYTIHHDGVEHAGYLAFLGLLSLFPFLVFFVAIAGLIGESHQSSEMVKTIISVMPEQVVAALKPRINEIVSGPPQGLLTISIIGVIWTASSAVEGLRTILNRAYRVETPPAYIWRRLLSIAQFLALTAITIIGMAFLVVWPVVWSWFETALNIKSVIDNSGLADNLGYVRYGLSSMIVFLAIATSYYILPNIKQRWVATVPGALIVLLLWLLCAEIFTAYLSNFDQINSIYGSLGGIIASLLFFYMTALIFIFGAEFNYFLEKAMGRKIIQREKA